MILLTDEEIANAVWGNWTAEHLRVAKAQLKKVVEWGEEMCIEHCDNISVNSAQWKRRHCSKCWELLKEIE